MPPDEGYFNKPSSSRLTTPFLIRPESGILGMTSKIQSIKHRGRGVAASFREVEAGVMKAETEMNLSVRLLRSFLTGFCLWLAVVMGAASAVAAEVSCDDWNTQKFFERANAADIVRCVKAGENPVSRSVFSGDSPLHNAAAYSANPAVIEALVKAGADPNARNLYKRTTPLHAAAAFGKTPTIIAALVKAGAKVNLRDKFKQTPLHTAARESGTPAVVAALLDAGANPGARNKSGKTPFDYAKENPALQGTKVYRRLNEERFKRH